MADLFSRIINNVNDDVLLPDDEYMGEDGLMHCSFCHDATQTRVIVESLNIDRIVRCCCSCKRKEAEEYEARKEQEEIERKRRTCFNVTNMSDWTFENDDRQNAKLSDAMQRYADNFPKYIESGKGLLLYGTVGTGKTYYAACIANRLIDRGYKVLVTNFARLSNQIQGTWEKQDLIDDLNDYHLLVIDDLGAERKSEFMQEQIFNIIDGHTRRCLICNLTKYPRARKHHLFVISSY